MAAVCDTCICYNGKKCRRFPQAILKAVDDWCKEHEVDPLKRKARQDAVKGLTRGK